MKSKKRNNKNKDKNKDKNKETLKIPSKLIIGGIEYQIEITSKVKDDNMQNWGFHHISGAKILLLDTYDSEKFAPCTFLHTFLHELIHAIDAIYIGNLFSEDYVNKFEDLWFTLLADNNLYIGEDKFPESIRILGRDYKVIKDYEFEEHIKDSPSVALTTDDLEIKIAGKEHASNHEILKCNLLEVLMKHICNPFFTEDEFKKINFHAFCSGLYQILKNSNLNKIIREWCK